MLRSLLHLMHPATSSGGPGARRPLPLGVVALLCGLGIASPSDAQTPRTGAGHTHGRLVVVPGGAGTHGAPHYLAEQVLGRDSVVRRWPERTVRPIRVWIEPTRAMPGWDAAFPGMVREALTEWSSIGIPLRFSEVTDSAAAEIHVHWRDRLGVDESGRTVWWSTAKGWITRARITLSTHASDGVVQTQASLRAVALHEIGHALGLRHVADGSHIMAAWIEVAGLSDADRNTARLLYRLPAGRVTPVLLAELATRPGCIATIQRCNAMSGAVDCPAPSCQLEVVQ